jgi:hypothetical protein
VVDNPCNRGVCNHLAGVHWRRDGRRQGRCEMITVGDLLAVAGLLCGLLIVTGVLVFLAWMADQQKADQTKGGEE